MRILAIDPGPQESAWVYWGCRSEAPFLFEKQSNESLVARIAREFTTTVLVVEQVCSYGMVVGKEVFDTVWWSGRFAQAFNGREAVRLPRLTVKTHLCHDSRAKDSNIRQALLDRFGGKVAAVGTKKQPGPLYGIHGDCWQALALALTWWDLHGAEGR